MPPLTPEEIATYHPQVPEWKVVDNHSIERDYKFKNFKEALAFVNQVGEIAEEENHHPNIFLHGWNKVKLSLYTHAIDGLSENDFILASKIDLLLEGSGSFSERKSA